MSAYYGKDASDCDLLTEAEFAANIQSIERIEQFRANVLTATIAKLFGSTGK